MGRNKYILGKCDYNGNGRKDCEAVIEWELKDGRFSMSAEIWNPKKTDIYQGGQCVDTVAAYFPKDKLAARMVEVWKQYHLNDTKAYSPEMAAAGWDEIAKQKALGYEFTRTSELSAIARKAEDAAKDAARAGETFNASPEQRKAMNTPYSLKIWVLEGEDAPEPPEGMGRAKHLYGYNKGNLKTPEQKTLGWLSPDEHPQGLLGRKLNEGDEYGYGQKWFKHELPADIVEEIESWKAATRASRENQTDDFADFLEKHFEIASQYIEQCDKHTDLYRCTITAKATKKSEVFEFRQGIGFRKDTAGRKWNERAAAAGYHNRRVQFSPQKSAPSLKTVIDAIAQDTRLIDEYGDYLEFSDALGFEDAKEARRVWVACDTNRHKLKALAGEHYHKLIAE